MIELARDIIGTQPILTLFLAIGVGYLVGQINLGGFSLGVGAVVFVGLVIGAFAPKAQITGPISLTGLPMFLYGIGILYGRQFVAGMSGAAGRHITLLERAAMIRGLISLTGLPMFLYGIGILYGRQFFEGMSGAAGRKYNLLALVAVIAGLVVALGLGQVFGIKIGHTLGIYAGSMTSTATLQA